MTTPTAPTCQNCGGAHDLRIGPWPTCIRHLATRLTEAETLLRGYNAVNKALAERIARLEAKPVDVLPFVPWSKAHEMAAPAPAEPVRYETVGEINLREQAKNDNESKSWRMGAPVPTVEAPRCERCEHGPNFHDGAPCCFHSRQGTCGCPEYIAPAANAEPERDWYEEMSDGEAHPTIDGWVRDRSKRHGWRKVPKVVPPVPPRPEGQGTVTHEEARTVVANFRRDYGKALWCESLLQYISDNEARDKAQAAEIEELCETLAGVRHAWHRDVAKGREFIAEADRLRAELAALKQPVPVQAVAAVREVMAQRFEQQSAPAPADGTGNRKRIDTVLSSLGIGFALTRKQVAELLERLTELLDAAEQRGRASRDGVVPEVEAWRNVEDAKQRFIIKELCDEALRDESDGALGDGYAKEYRVAARLLRALASDAGGGK